MRTTTSPCASECVPAGVGWKGGGGTEWTWLGLCAAVLATVFAPLFPQLSTQRHRQPHPTPHPPGQSSPAATGCCDLLRLQHLVAPIIIRRPGVHASCAPGACQLIPRFCLQGQQHLLVNKRLLQPGLWEGGLPGACQVSRCNQGPRHLLRSGPVLARQDLQGQQQVRQDVPARAQLQDPAGVLLEGAWAKRLQALPHSLLYL
jgi:hypothetical protein